MKCDKCGTIINLFKPIVFHKDEVVKDKQRCGFCLEEDNSVDGICYGWILIEETQIKEGVNDGQ